MNIQRFLSKGWKLCLLLCANIILNPQFLILNSLQAQTTKSIVVSHEVPSSDQLSFADEDKDTDLTVKFLFNEDSNTLTVVLTSPKTLLVFWADTR